MHSVLLIHCPDQPGLVYKITQVVYQYNLNIISNGEFVERNFNHFFMRTEFSGTYDQDELLRDLKSALPPEAEINLRYHQKRNICILVTKEHHCLSDLLIRHAFQELDANIRCVISNYRNLEELTAKFEIPFHYVPHENKNREE